MHYSLVSTEDTAELPNSDVLSPDLKKIYVVKRLNVGYIV